VNTLNKLLLITNHLISRKYKFEEETKDGWLVYKHIDFPHILLKSNGALIYLCSAYQINSLARKDKFGFFEMVNELNRKAVTGTYVAIIGNEPCQDQLMIKTIWQGVYDRKQFELFLDDWQFETNDAIWEIDGIENFIILS